MSVGKDHIKIISFKRNKYFIDKNSSQSVKGTTSATIFYIFLMISVLGLANEGAHVLIYIVILADPAYVILSNIIKKYKKTKR